MDHAPLRLPLERGSLLRNGEIAALFESIADLLDILGESPFRSRSYRRAARVLSGLSEPVEEAAAAGRLEDLPGIGAALSGKVREYLATGGLSKHRELLSKVPPGLPGLLAVPGLGPKRAAMLWREAGVASVEDLRKLIETDVKRLGRIEGFGPTTIRNLWQGLNFMAKTRGRISLGQADQLALRLLEAVRRAGGTDPAAAGSLRRGRETVGRIRIVSSSPPAGSSAVVEAFAACDGVARVLSRGPAAASVELQGEVRSELSVPEPESYGAALAGATGSKAHFLRLASLARERGLRLEEGGLYRGEDRLPAEAEETVYAALGLPFIEPELREDRGEIEAAREGRLPRLIKLSDIQGDLHMHTDGSDGRNSPGEMIAACRERGYRYLAVCDHSKRQVQAGGLDERRLMAHAGAVRAAAARFPAMRVLMGVEVDILKDGSLDLDEGCLADLDFAVASCHSSLGMGREESTRRLLKAMDSPYVRCIGHPTGRMIHSREGLDIDVSAVARAAAQRGVALEINSHWMRLDLRDSHARTAIGLGAKICINTDAHSTQDLDLMRFGVATARRAWASAEDVVNAWPLERLEAWLRRR
jgi:DNA polymerase (family 10)